MAKHTLYVDCELFKLVDAFGHEHRSCAVHAEPWPCPKLTAYNKEIERRFWAKRKQPVRLVHGAHSTDGPRGWKE